MTTTSSGQRSERRPIVLIVDDLPDNLSTISEMIADLGLEIRVAGNGPAALRYAEIAPIPDLILLDIMMPGMDGHEVLRHLRANPHTAEIPVIFVTALGDPESEQTGLIEGAADYIAKPINPAVLRARILTQLEIKRVRDQLADQKDWLEDEVDRRTAIAHTLEARLKQTLEASGFGLWELNRANGELSWSMNLAQAINLETTPETVDGWLALVHPEDRPRLSQLLTQASDIHPVEFRISDRDGNYRFIELRGHVIAPATTHHNSLSGVLVDITERRQQEAEQRLAAAVFSGISEGICITGPDANILLINDAFSRITGYSLSEVVGRNPRILKSGNHSPAFYGELWRQLTQDGHWQGEITNRRKSGELVSEWLSISVVRDPHGRAMNYIGIFSDLSERKEASSRIQYLATFDPLTDLPNRTLLSDRLTQALFNANRFNRQTAVFLLDLDRFRSINDTLGPPVGDLILIEVGRRLSLQVREGDTVGRRGGNEFGFVMANLAHEHDAIALAQRMLETIATPFDVGGQHLTLTASIGISVAPRNGQDAEALLKNADIALSRAKEAGKNTFRFYSPEMDADTARRLTLENSLRGALANHELSLVYQPQVSLETGKLIGMEALLRWNHLTLGPISPGEFIPIAEDTGLIVPIGAWVLREACHQTRRWLDLGLASLRVAVNLSTRQFRQSDLLREVSDALAESGLPPSALELEITESAFIDDVDNAIAQSLALKDLGIKLSLDDFGTGYSSLSYLSRFPFDKIKIDQGFVHDITENPINAAIASAAIVMARSLNLSVLAEGVETEAQARFLRARRCDSIQGFLFSRPLNASDFEALLAGHPTLPLNEDDSSDLPTLLLVDDEPNVLSALTRLFRREGYHILIAHTPAEGFELLAKHPVQVIVSDQRMPDMTGTEFFTRVRQLYPDTIRIVLTGYTDLETVTDAINHGAIYKFLTKPWDDDALREQIREAFRLAADVRRLNREL